MAGNLEHSSTGGQATATAEGPLTGAEGTEPVAGIEPAIRPSPSPRGILRRLGIIGFDSV